MACLLWSCSWKVDNSQKDRSKMFTQAEILDQLDLAFKGIPSSNRECISDKRYDKVETDSKAK